MNKKILEGVASVLRRDSLEMTSVAGSGHPSSCLSCAEIMSVLFFDVMDWDVKNSENPDNDEFILSKGHAAPILYSALKRAGAINDDLMKLRKLHSRLEGHPVPRSLNWVKVASGSLGQGLSAGVGMALAGKKQNRKFRTFVLLGDSELAEGSNYEAFQLASYYNLDNLVVIVDANRLGQRGETMVGHDLEIYAKRIKSFGWDVKIVDGHDVEKLSKALKEKKRKPFALIVRTFKGRGVSFLENEEGWHGKALNKEELVRALKEIPVYKIPKIKIKKPKKFSGKVDLKVKKISEVLEKNVATREAWGFELARMASRDPKMIVVDAEVSNSTFSNRVKEVCGEKFVESFIAEQNMIGVCLGLSKKGFRVFGSTFAAFLSRAHDQIRMSALSNGNFTLCGSHAGVSIGSDGASQMGLKDIAMFRALPNSIIVYPCDGKSTRKLINLASKRKGLKYVRTTRAKTSEVYSNEKFRIGDFGVLKKSAKDKIVLVGAGITLHEALKAHEKLKSEKINSAVVDLYCVKPFDSKKFIGFVKKHGKKIVIAEDHYFEGGIGEMLAEELENSGIEIKHLAVGEIPHSGSWEELLKKYKIDSGAIVRAVRKLV